MTDMVDIAWAAGILEGEGSFIRRNVNSCAVQCSMTDLDILLRLQSLFGGSVYEVGKRQSHWKDAWVWRLNGAHAASVMRAVLPFMGVRRSSKINSLLSEWDEVQASNAIAKSDLLKRNAEIRAAYATGGITMRRLGELFGVSRQTVCDVVHEVKAP